MRYKNGQKIKVIGTAVNRKTGIVYGDSPIETTYDGYIQLMVRRGKLHIVDAGSHIAVPVEVKVQVKAESEETPKKEKSKKKKRLSL